MPSHEPIGMLIYGLNELDFERRKRITIGAMQMVGLGDSTMCYAAATLEDALAQLRNRRDVGLVIVCSEAAINRKGTEFADQMYWLAAAMSTHPNQPWVQIEVDGSHVAAVYIRAGVHVHRGVLAQAIIDRKALLTEQA